MKKLLSIAFAAGSLAALADPVTVYTGQGIGSIPITSSRTNTIVAVAFNELGPVAKDISVSNIVSTANLAVDDKVYVLNGNKYDGWILKSGVGGTYKYWDKHDKVLTIGNGGKVSEGDGTPANGVTKAVGTGIWLQRGPNWDGTSFTFYVYGAVPSSNTVVVAHGVKSLFGNPKSTAAAPTVTGMANGDQILIPTDGVPKTCTYSSTKGTWYYRDSTGGHSAIPAIDPGHGAWYISKGSNDVTINW